MFANRKLILKQTLNKLNMKINRFLVIVFGLFTTICQAQDLKKIEKEKSKLLLFEEQKFDTEMYKNNIGKVCFSNEEFERALPESKYIKSYNLGDKLTMRAYMSNSPANSMLLQLVDNGKKAKEVNDNKSSFENQSKVQFVLYFDGKKITNTSYAQTFKSEDMTSLPSHRADINDATDKVYFGEELYKALLLEQQLLTPGAHKLKIELVPFKTNGFGSDIEYKPIAVGEIDMIIPKEIKVTENDCFPKSALNDPKLEKEVLNACKNFFKSGESTLLKAILAYDDIFIIRNEYGVILKKSFMACIVYKNGNELGYEYYIFDKVYDGSKYLDAKLSKDITLNGYTTPSGRKVNNSCIKFLK